MYLLDTNALLILFHDDLTEATLSETTRQLILSEDRLYLSIASLWEMSIKVKIGRLDLKKPISAVEENCYQQGIEIIPIKGSHLDETVRLPLLNDHKDPFDRLIVATSKVEGMTLISTDGDIQKNREEYGINVVW